MCGASPSRSFPPANSPKSQHQTAEASDEEKLGACPLHVAQAWLGRGFGEWPSDSAPALGGDGPRSGPNDQRGHPGSQSVHPATELLSGCCFGNASPPDQTWGLLAESQTRTFFTHTHSAPRPLPPPPPRRWLSVNSQLMI